MASVFESLLGSVLQGKNGEVSTSAELSGKVVGLYFSAHWCPPCRMFTPELANYYQVLMSKGLPFEIVFCSSDRNESQFNEYYNTMPWLALPFSARDKKNALSNKFSVSGIPTLVLLNENGETITKSGRDHVSSDPQGNEFPYTPKPFLEVIGEEFLCNQSIVSRDSLIGNYIGVYFSAHWCQPCQLFTPQLVQRYNLAKQKGLPFEILFVSWDSDENSFTQYFSQMPWLALPFNQRKTKEKLDRLFSIQGIPSLVIINPEGGIENKNARTAIMNDPRIENFPWTPSPLINLSEGASYNGLSVNDVPSFICLMENSDDSEQTEISSVLSPIASQFIQSNPQSPQFLFMIASSSSDISDRIRGLVHAGPVKHASDPIAFLLDIPDNGGYYSFSGDVTSETEIRNFLDQWKNKTIERKQLG